jgi:Domain of unknown function (DUF6443)
MLQHFSFGKWLMKCTTTVVLMSFLHTYSVAQVTIGGPTCVNYGTRYSYVLSAYYSGTTSYTYSVSGGTLSTGGSSGTHNGPGVASIDIIWTSSGSISVVSPAGSAVLSVKATPALVSGSITSGQVQNIAFNTVPAVINCAAASGGPCTLPTYIYQWQQSPDNISFFNVTGATAQNLVFTVGQNSSTYYRRLVTETTTGVSAYSNTASIILTPPIPVLPLIAGSVSPLVQTIYYNAGSAQLSVSGVANGTYAYSYQWQKSTDNITWSNVGATIPMYTPASLTTTSYYRITVSSNGTTAYSTSAKINVYPQLRSGVVSPDYETISSGGSAGSFAATPAAGSDSIYTYQWQTSADGVNFTYVSGATALNYNPGTITANKWLRLMVTSGGVSAYSNAAQIVISSTVPDMNYVRVREIKKPGMMDTAAANNLTSPYDVSQTIQYFDGLGRPVQTVAMQQSPALKDLVTMNVYDIYGREAVKFLPYVAPSADGSYKVNAQSDQYNFNVALFPNEQYYYSQSFIESSPLNRPLISFSPGLSWVGSSRGITSQYLVNTVSDSVRNWSISFAAGSIPVSTSIFAAGTLFKEVTIDEAGHEVVEYKDKAGKTILKKVQLATSPGTAHAGWLCTYNVYDIMNHLRFVIQPQAVNVISGSWVIFAGVANELCFRYEYDLRNRLIIKKVPGAGEVWMVYDMRDRLVMSQDSMLRGQRKWLTIKYDLQNRADSNGLFTDTHDRIFHQALADTSINYPAAGATFELLTRTYYDSYDWAQGNGISTAVDKTNTANSNYFFTTSNPAHTYAVPINQFPITRGMTTGIQTKVIGSAAQYLYTATFYDDRGKAIQSQSINYTGGLDKATTQYDFTGKALRTLQQHQKNGVNAQSHTILTKMNYDAGGRLLTVYKNIDNAPADQLIVTNRYNELGQLQNKTLGNNLDSLAYLYNVRGWLTSINKNYLFVSMANYFEMELGYDKLMSMKGVRFTQQQFTGNIEGIVWKSKGDGVSRKYDYGYDNVNRLTSADFHQNSNGSAWDNNYLDFSVNNLTYDANGNILSMNQKGFKINGSALIDSLKYTYATNSNKLSRVDDYANDPLSKLGDFHYSGTKQPVDYNYDGNGNMVSDNNKAISAIAYNYLNLPGQVTVTSKGTISYTYDAAGNKLKKTTIEGTKNTTTLYVGNFVYQNDTLQFAGHEEGRTRWVLHHYVNGSSGYGFEYDFFVKDHLGDTRMVLTQEKDTAQYIATMEAAYRNTENALFNNIPQSAYPRSGVAGYPADNTTVPNDSLVRVNGSGQKTGPSLLLRVMSGDVIDVATKSFYRSGGTMVSSNSTLTDILNALAGSLVTATGGSHGVMTDLTNSSSSPVYSALNSFLPAHDSLVAGKPKAYLNWILLDDQFKGVSTSPQSGALPVGNADVLTTLAYTGIPITKNGYVYIWVSNETPGWDVFFDNLSVRHYSGPLMEETHYYPFGLTMAGISSKAVGCKESKKRFQGQELAHKEFVDGSGLEMYEFKWRMDDPQTGRFWQIDPLADKYVYNSTYAFSENKVIVHRELEGLESDYIFQKAKEDLASTFQGAANWVDNTISYFTKSSSSTVVASTPLYTTSVGTSVTTNTNTNFGGNMNYIINNNTNKGNTEPLTKTTTTVTAETKTDFKVAGVTVTNKTGVSNSGVITNELGGKTNVVIEDLPATMGGSVSKNSNGQTTTTAQGTTNFPGGVAQGTTQVQYSTNGKQQSVSVGVGGQATTGKTTTTVICGIKFNW